VRPAGAKHKLAKRLNSRRFRMAFCSTIPRSFTRDFHFDLPDGVSYTPNTLPSKSIRLSSPDLPARETAKPSSR
jgi:hypothetical protein